MIRLIGFDRVTPFQGAASRGNVHLVTTIHYRAPEVSLGRYDFQHYLLFLVLTDAIS